MKSKDGWWREDCESVFAGVCGHWQMSDIKREGEKRDWKVTWVVWSRMPATWWKGFPHVAVQQWNPGTVVLGIPAVQGTIPPFATWEGGSEGHGSMWKCQ